MAKLPEGFIAFDNNKAEDVVEKQPKQKITQLPEGFIAFDNELSSKPKGTTSVTKDVASQGTKGFLAGLGGTFGDILDIFNIQSKNPLLPGQEALAGAESTIKESSLPFLQDEDIAPRFSRLPSQEDIVDTLGIGDPETTSGKFSERIGKAVGSGLSFAGSPAVLASMAGGAIAGQTAEELGASPLSSSLVELTASLGLGAIQPRLMPGKAQKSLVETGRNFGLTEKQLTPLIQQETKLNVLSKFARKGSKLENLFAEIETTLGDSYGTLKNNAKDLPKLSANQKEELVDTFGKTLKEINATLAKTGGQKQASTFIEEAIETIKTKDVSSDQLINFYQSLNKVVDWGYKGGNKSLVALKKPIVKALNKSDPSLARDFENLNKLYSNFIKSSKKLKPGIFDKLASFGEAGTLIKGIATMHPSLIGTVATEIGTRTLAREMLVNPIFQNLSKKILVSLGKDALPKTAAIAVKGIKQLQKKYPNEIDQDIDLSELTNIGD